jgi:acyl dehydratase
MPLNPDSIGSLGEPWVHEIDARWVMSYATGIGDTLPCYLDTLRPEGVIAHPLFPVCVEWPVIVDMRKHPVNASLTQEEYVRAVHATHDTVIHRPIRPGDKLTTQATIVGLEQRKPGAYQTMRLDTTDADGALVISTWQGAVYRGVKVDGPDRPADDPPTPMTSSNGNGSVRAEVPVPIATEAAHVYTECARIWNPVHTDAAVAAAAGLPAIILHGTATLALGVSRVIELEADNQPERVKRIACRFGAMVLMPSEVTVRILSREATAEGDAIHFEVRTEDGGPAVRDGLVVLHS